MTSRRLVLHVNGAAREVSVAPSETLLDVLHDRLGHTDVRYGCGEGVCGTCTVLADGAPVNACLLLAIQAEEMAIDTVTSLLDHAGELHPLQASILEHGGSQCGFCTPGIVLTALALGRRNPSASRDDIRFELVGNLCRCTGYTKIIDAVEHYFRSVEAEGGECRAD
jgi:carbon-monoxide dehydrogenase small subunit